MNLAFMNIGTQEMVVIILVALLLFGGKKLPELARGLGKGIREFKDASEGIKREISDQINNFEKEIDEVKSDIEKEPESNNSTSVNPTESYANNVQESEDNENTEVKEKKTPQFSAPSGTYEHQPYRTPTEEDYYSYGYKDHFDNNEQVANDADQTTSSTEGQSTEEHASKEDHGTKNA